MIALLVGTVLSLAIAGLARMYPPGRERLVYAVGLVITALVYVVFGVVGDASVQWLAFESLGVFLYGAAALGGLRGRPWLLAMGWAAHVSWDALFHLSGAGSEYTPHWYPWLCVSFDLVMAGAVLASSRRAVANIRGTA
jgi:hypothetical protein